MKHTLLFIGLLFIGIEANSQTATLVKDINPGTGNGILEWKDSNAKLGDAILFAADNGTIGSELYKLQNGVVTLVKDLIIGSMGSDPNNFITYKGKVYFSAKNSNDEYDIYVTDGTSANTTKAITLSEDRHVYEFFEAKNGKLYFNLGGNIYVTEGTTATTQNLITNDVYVNFDNSWTYASTNIVDYKNGVAFSGYLDKTFYILHHTGSAIDTLHKFTSNYSTEILGPVATSTGLVYGTQNNFYEEYVGVFHIDKTSKAVTELKINNTKIDLSRIYEVNGSYCLIKPFSGDFYSYNGTSFQKLSTAGASFSLYQGERLPHAVNGNSLFFFGKEDWFNQQYYITDGTTNGTVEVETPEDSYPGKRILVENNFAYMFQGTTNGFTASLVKIDFTTKTAETIYTATSASSTESNYEIINILGDKVYFTAQLTTTIGRELYVVTPPVPNTTEYWFPKSGSKQLTSCDTIIYDDGGSSKNYSDNVQSTLTLLPSGSGKKIKLSFLEFSVEDGWDYLKINNNGINSSLTGYSLPNDITSGSANGGIALTFESDDSSTDDGFKIKVSCESIVGLAKNTSNTTTIYPNPSTGSISYLWDNNTYHNIVVTDLTGKTVYTSSSSNVFNQLSLNHLENGMYEITLSDNESITSQKIVINK